MAIADASSAPVVTAIQNNYGLIPQGLPNWGIAPGSLFLIKGSALANVTTQLQSSAAPGLQTTLAGVTVNVTVGTVTVQCFLYYLSPVQIDAVLPSSTPMGLGTLTVTSNGRQSAAAQINVATSAFGILSYNGTLAAGYDANNQPLTPSNSANPNQTIVLWGSGVGSDTANDDSVFPQRQNNLTGLDFHAFVGGQEANVLYRGRSQYPGVDQVVLTIPSNTVTGCYVGLAIVTGIIVSNSSTIPIAPSGRTCSDSNVAFAPAQLEAAALQGTVRQAVLGLDNNNNAYGVFQTIGNFGASIGSGSVSIGSCLVYFPTNPSGTTTGPLDAGPAITVTSPTGSSVTLSPSPATFYTAPKPLPAGFPPHGEGTFVFDNGTGGNDVGHFTAELNYPPLSFGWTNPPQFGLSVGRADGLTVNWTGGSADSYVSVNGGMMVDTENSQIVDVTFVCEAPLSAGSFTIPPWVTLSLPPGTMILQVGLISNPVPFTAKGLDLGFLRDQILEAQPVIFR